MLNYIANMTQRNMLCTNPMLDFEMDQQGQNNPQSGHCMFLGNIAHYPQHPNVLPVLSASGNTSNIDLRCLPDHESSIFFANQFNGLQQHHPITNFNLGAPSNYYNPYMIPSSLNRICPVPLHRGSSDQPQSSGHRGLIGVASNDYDGNSHLIDGARSSGKRKNAEGFPGNHNANGSASSSSSSSGIMQNAGIPQMPERFQSGAGVLEVASFQPPDYRVNSSISLPATSRRSVRSRSSDAGHQVDPNQLHNQNHVVQGNYMGQAFQPTSSPWVEQQFGNNGGDGGSSTWNSTTAMPYMHGRSVSGASLDVTGMTGQGFPPDTMNGRSSAMFLHPSVQHHQFHPHLHPSPIQSMQGHNYHPQPAIPTYRNPTSNSLIHGTLNPYVDGPDSLVRFPRALPSNGIRIYRPQRIGNRQSASNSSHQTHLRILAEDEVAILEIPGFYEVGGGHIDQHRDMRLDIDDMSYEELLALGERIGSVKTGLSEENISRCLKTRVHFSSEKDDMDQEMVGGTCIICQLDYENKENLGILECGHEYHADCIKQWLVLKNVCPICKMPALSI